MSESIVMFEERRRLLLAELRKEGRVVATEAADRFGVSDDTIRRDLRELAAKGLAQRVRGGALSLVRPPAPFGTRVEDVQPALFALAGAVAERLSNAGGVVVLDNGVTSLRIAEQLTADADLTVVTSSPAIGAAAALRRVTVLMLGGVVDPAIGASVDAIAVGALADVRADVSVLGTCAVDAELGISTAQPEEVAFKKAVVAAGAEVFVVATAEKLGTAATFRVAETDELSVVFTEAFVDADATAGFDRIGVEVVRV